MEERKQQNTPITFAELALALANDYECIYVIDSEDDSYVEYVTAGAQKELVKRDYGDNFYKAVLYNCRKQVYPEDQTYFLETFKKETVTEVLKNGKSFSLNYRLVIDGKPTHYFLKTIRGTDQKVVIGVQNVDAQRRRELITNLERQTYMHISGALASRYEAIYYIDIQNNAYTQYSASDEYAKLGTTKQGADFFVDAVEDCRKYLHPDDVERVLRELEKERLIQHLNENGSVTMTYRQLLGDRSQYVSMIVVRPKNDPNHIVIALLNVDAQIRRQYAPEDEAAHKEDELVRTIGSAIELVNKDALTGVKNQQVYADMELQLNGQIKAKTAEPFALVVCDVNEMKQVNDAQGLGVGDAFLKSACTMLCDTFKHSPVFRVDGDAFIVLLRGNDYENRSKLNAEFARKQVDHKRNGLVTLAFGMSDYDPEKDTCVRDVFTRAENLMYGNKDWIKGDLPQETLERHELQNEFMRFYVLYEQLVSAMTEISGVDVPRIESLLIEISAMFRLSKAVTYIYRNPQEEKMGVGETLCCYDTGKEGKEILSLRVVTKVMSSARMVAYMAPDEIPLTEEERWKVELVMRTTLTFVTRNRLRDMIEELTYNDENGYPNFRSLANYIVRAAIEGKNRDLVAFHYNLRHFSLINQEFGRAEGDVIMRNHFETIRKTIGDWGYLVRLGGDNFVGICQRDIFEDVKSLLASATISFGSGNCVTVTSRTGAYAIPDGQMIQKPNDFMEQIIAAYRVAQSKEGEILVYFNDALLEKREKSMKIQKMFPDALQAGEFQPYYQPKVNVYTGELDGAEALCRWIRDREIIPPGAFIPVLEQTSDICKLDLYMLERVCKDLRQWMDEGKKVVRVSVNFSRKNIMNPNLTEFIVGIVDRYHVPHEYIEIELTETTTDVEFNDLKRIACGLHDNGIYTAVDDFGVGFSSLNLIRDIPWNVLKIDRSFLPEEEDKENSVRNVMFKNVVTLARQLGLECIAEGVETEFQMNVLRENHCNLAQGYFYDRPLPVTEFEKRLDKGIYE